MPNRSESFSLSRNYRRWIYLIAALLINAAWVIGWRTDAFSQAGYAPVQDVRWIDIERFGLSDAAGLAFAAAEDRFYLIEGGRLGGFDMLEAGASSPQICNNIFVKLVSNFTAAAYKHCFSFYRCTF